MKIVARVGSESHTSSSASAALKDGLGRLIPGKMAPDTENSCTNARYFLLEVDLPTGTMIHYAGSGKDGPRGVNRYGFDRLYRVGDETTPIVEESPDLGPVNGLIKGRLVLARDFAAERVAAARISTTEGF